MPKWTRGRWKAILNAHPGTGDFKHSITHREDDCDLIHAACDSAEDAYLIEQAPDLYKALDRITDITICRPNPKPAHYEKWFQDLAIATEAAIAILTKARKEKPE